MSHARGFLAAFILATALLGAIPAGAQAQQDNDQTLRAMRDEMARSKTRLDLLIPGTDQPVRPYYVEYRLLDLDVREVGTVLEVKDGIARVYGLTQAMSGEMLEFVSSETGERITGLALNLEEDNIGAVIFAGSETMDACEGRRDA